MSGVSRSALLALVVVCLLLVGCGDREGASLFDQYRGGLAVPPTMQEQAVMLRTERDLNSALAAHPVTQGRATAVVALGTAYVVAPDTDAMRDAVDDALVDVDLSLTLREVFVELPPDAEGTEGAETRCDRRGEAVWAAAIRSAAQEDTRIADRGVRAVVVCHTALLLGYVGRDDERGWLIDHAMAIPGIEVVLNDLYYTRFDPVTARERQREADEAARGIRKDPY